MAANEALWDSLAGNFSQAREQVSEAVKLNSGRDVTGVVALVYALLGDSQKAQSLITALSSKYPENTIVNSVVAPEVKGVIETNQESH